MGLRFGNVAPWVARFAARNSHDLRANERERSLCHDSPPSEELALGAGYAIVMVKGPRVLPVAETETVMVGTATQIKDDTKNDQAGNGDDLDGREDELCFTINTGTKHIDHNYDDETYCDPSRVIDCSDCQNGQNKYCLEYIPD